MNKLCKTLSLLCSLTLMSNSIAETIQVPVSGQAADKQGIERPRSGTTGSAVIKDFGEPLATSKPVGDPPISRWEYQDYFVYFEYNHVIHSVLKHQASNTQ